MLHLDCWKVYLEVCDDLVLNLFIVEVLEKESLRVGRGRRHAFTQQGIDFIGKVFPDELAVTGHVDDITQGFETSFFLQELVSVTNTEEVFEVAKGDS
jgi:hypothetical protein